MGEASELTLSVFNRKRFQRKPAPLYPKTISDFSGGLDLIDNDLTLKSKYAKVLTNWVQGTDGSVTVRFGCKRKYDISGAVDGDLIELVYYNSHLIAFTTAGEIAKITEAGVVTAIWNSGIAALLPGAPSGWSTGLEIGTIDTCEFKQQLVVCNGVDKPLLIDTDLTVDYLQDLAVGTNVFTPIGKYCVTAANYTVIAGIASAPSTIYVSSQGTSGVWPGDAAPNDSVAVNLATYVPENSSGIIGLASFRNQLIVVFEGAIVVVTLGVYDSATGLIHQPDVQDNIVEHGIVNHRTIVTTKNDLVMADPMGWHTATKNSYGLIDTQQISELVAPEYQVSVSTDDTLRQQAFSVWDKLSNRITTFVANVDGTRTGWTLSFGNTVKKGAWAKHEGWSFTCGCTSARGRTFYGNGTWIYQAGNETFEDENYSADFIDEYDYTWMAGTLYHVGDRVLDGSTVYVTLVEHTSSTVADDLTALYIEEYQGEPITFDWELPWTDLNVRANKKRMKYFQADTKGTAQFNISLFVDNFYLDAQTGDYDPCATMGFVAGDSGGFGNNDQPYGGGRRLRDERPWSLPADFKILKIRVHGSTTKPLSVVTLTILYQIGSFKR